MTPRASQETSSGSCHPAACLCSVSPTLTGNTCWILITPTCSIRPTTRTCSEPVVFTSWACRPVRLFPVCGVSDYPWTYAGGFPAATSSPRFSSPLRKLTCHPSPVSFRARKSVLPFQTVTTRFGDVWGNCWGNLPGDVPVLFRLLGAHLLGPDIEHLPFADVGDADPPGDGEEPFQRRIALRGELDVPDR